MEERRFTQRRKCTPTPPFPLRRVVLESWGGNLRSEALAARPRHRLQWPRLRAFRSSWNGKKPFIMH